MDTVDDAFALGNFADVFNEDCSLGSKLLYNIPVVNDLLADVDGRAVEVECVLDGLNGTVDPRAIAARGREQDPLRDMRDGFRHRSEG